MERASATPYRWSRPRLNCSLARAVGARAAALSLLIFGVLTAPAAAHSAVLGSAPEPGTRLNDSPAQIRLDFTETLNRRLTTATLISIAGNKRVPSTSSVSGHKLILRPAASLPRAAYQMRWHSVSTEDGHALEGSFSFGVRTTAVGGEHSVEESPLARGGWARVLARALMYATFLLFIGALLLRALLGGPGRSWVVPAKFSSESQTDARVAARREHVLLQDLGLVAAGAAALSATADAADAAGELSLRGLHDYLLASPAGEARVAVFVLVLMAGLISVRRPRGAAVPATLALGALALSGHAASASPRLLSIGVDWVHLMAASVWLGGIALIVAIWGPTMRRASASGRMALAREVLPIFGRVAVPAFGLVVITGAVSALIELGSISALWRTDYGRVLVIKMGLVGLIAATSYVHAFRLRPRMLRAADHADESTDRRHWRLLRAEPLLGASVIAVVALLVAFPLPPRQLRDSDEARAAEPACDPCALAKPQTGELAVAEQAGSDVVAAWLHHQGPGLAGEVRVYGLSGRPAPDPLRVIGARQSPCGVGCRRLVTPRVPAQLRVEVRQRGHAYVAVLETRWRADDSASARRWLDRAQRRMRGLRSVKEVERVTSVPGLFAQTDYRLKAPDRFAYRTNGGVRSVVIGKQQWERPDPRLPWRKIEFGGGLPFRTTSWFNWTTYARHVYLLRVSREGQRRVAVVATMDPGTPAWWRLYIDLDSFLVRRSRLVTSGHFMTQTFSGFNQPIRVAPPPAAHGR